MKACPVWVFPSIIGILTAMAPSASACAVCFGRTDSPLGKGLHWGVLALLAFVFAMLAAFGAFAVYLARRSAAAEFENEVETEIRGDPTSAETPTP